MLLSREEQITHLQSGWEKQISVILLLAAYLNDLTLTKPDLAFIIVKDMSVSEKANKSFNLL